MKKLKQGAYWSLLGAVVSRLMYVAAFIASARIIGVEAFGMLGMLQSTVFVLEVIAGSGFGITATRYVALFKATDTLRAGHIIGMTQLGVLVVAASLATVVMLAAAPLSTFLFNDAGQSVAIKITALTIFLGSVAAVQTGIIAGFEAFRRNAWISASSGLAVLIFMPCLAALSGPAGAIGGLGLARGLTCWLNRAAIKAEVSRHAMPSSIISRDALAELRTVIHYSVPSLLTNGLAALVFWGCNTLLVRQPNGLFEMAIANVGNQWRNMFLFLPNVVTQVAAPLFAQLGNVDSHDRDQARKLYQQLRKLNLAFVMPCALVCLLASPVIMQLYGQALAPFWLTFDLFILAVSLQVLQAPAVMILQSRGLIWSNFWMNVVWATTLLVGAIGMVHRGALGIALANLGAFAIFGLLLRQRINHALAGRSEEP